MFSADLGCGPGQTVPDSSWQIRPEDIEICQKPDGSGDWQLGSGGFGKVFSVMWHACMYALEGVTRPHHHDTLMVLMH